MLRLYFAPLTRSVRVRWLLEELEHPHEQRPALRRALDAEGA